MYLSPYLSSAKNDDKCHMSLENLLLMSSGSVHNPSDGIEDHSAGDRRYWWDRPLVGGDTRELRIHEMVNCVGRAVGVYSPKQGFLETFQFFFMPASLDSTGLDSGDMEV